jgi:hypothetical protein
MLILSQRRMIRPPAPKNAQVGGYAIGQSVPIREALRPRKIVLVLFTLCLLFQPKANSDVREVKRVLVFYEMGLSSRAVSLIDHEMLATLESQEQRRSGLIRVEARLDRSRSRTSAEGSGILGISPVEKARILP